MLARPWLTPIRAVLLARDSIIIIYRACPGRIRPVPGIVVAVLRRALQLSLRDAGDVATKVGVILQRLPRERIMIVADAQETSEAKHSIGDLAARLVDHDPFNRTDFGFVRAINGGAFDLIA